MNVLQSVRNYVAKMVNSHQGLKALIMDEETVRIVSVAFAKSELLIDHFGANKHRLRYELKASLGSEA